MTPRAARNKGFDAVTPGSLKSVYRKHGRTIANEISFSRILMAPLLFTTATAGNKGRMSGALRAIKTVFDGYDGYVAEQDEGFATAKPHIMNLKQLKHAILARNRPLADVLHDTAGGPLDHQADQVAQFADQLGNVLGRDLNPLYVALNGSRNALLKRIRAHYFELTGKTPHSRPAGQAKTVIMDTHQMAESFGWLQHAPQARAAFTVAGAAAISYSFVDAVSALERSYLADRYDVSELSTTDCFLLGCARYAARNWPNVEVYPTHALPLTTAE